MYSSFVKIYNYLGESNFLHCLNPEIDIVSVFEVKAPDLFKMKQLFQVKMLF